MVMYPETRSKKHNGHPDGARSKKLFRQFKKILIMIKIHKIDRGGGGRHPNLEGKGGRALNECYEARAGRCGNGWTREVSPPSRCVPWCQASTRPPCPAFPVARGTRKAAGRTTHALANGVVPAGLCNAVTEVGVADGANGWTREVSSPPGLVADAGGRRGPVAVRRREPRRQRQPGRAGGDGDAAGREGRQGEAQEQLLAARTARAEAGR